MVLLRRVIGDALRTRRQEQHRTLREVSSAANVSLGYLSEIERGQKEPSSELLAAICAALGARLSELLRDVSDTVELTEDLPGVLVPASESERVAATRPGSGPPADAQPTRRTSRPGPSGPSRPPAQSGPPRRPAQAESTRQPAPAEPMRQPVRSEGASSRPALADAAVRTLTEGGLRQVAIDGNVSVTVRQESPLKTTLRATRRVHSTSHDRDIVCAL